MPQVAGAAEPGLGVTGSSSNGPRVSPVFTYPLKSCLLDCWPVRHGASAGGALGSDGCVTTRMPYMRVLLGPSHDAFDTLSVCFFEAWFEFELTVAYLPGRVITLADDLSRNHLSRFLSKALSLDPTPTRLHPSLPE